METTNRAAELPPMFSYFNQDLRVSLEAPRGWEAGRTDDFILLLLGPKEQNYRTNLGLNARNLDPATPDELERIVKEAQKEQETTLAGYRLTRQTTYLLDNRPAFVRFYQWHDPELNLDFSQLQAVVLVSDDLVYSVDGSTIQELEDTYMPVLEHMLDSLRFIQLQNPD